MKIVDHILTNDKNPQLFGIARMIDHFKGFKSAVNVGKSSTSYLVSAHSK